MRQWVDNGRGLMVRASQPIIEVAPAVEPTVVGEISLATLPNVEILEVGENWETSTGSFTWDEEDLQSAVAAIADPAIRAPIIKIGHTDERFNAEARSSIGTSNGHEAMAVGAVGDGQPALGRLTNIHTTNNDQTLVADFTAMPMWLAQCMYSAFPRRSIEGWFDLQSKTGNLWPFALTAVALLGEAYPAIVTLEDIQALYGSEAPVLYPVEFDEELVTATTDAGTLIKARRITDVKWNRKKAAASAATSAEVAASASVDDVITAYYDSLGPGQDWWWIRQVLVEPLQIVVDSDNGQLLLIDVTADTDDNITFGDPVEVKIEYVAASGGVPNVRQPGQLVAATHKTPADTGRKVRAAQPDQEPQVEERTMLTDDALARLGLEPGASEDAINAAILASINAGDGDGDGDGETTPPAGDDGNGDSQPETPATAPEAQPATTPETPAGDKATDLVAAAQKAGMVLVDAGSWQEVQEGVKASNALITQQRTDHRDNVIRAAARDGKFPAARLEHYTTMWDADPSGTEELIKSMQPGLIPVEARGLEQQSAEQVAAESAYPDSWKPKVAASNAKTAGMTKVVGD